MEPPQVRRRKSEPKERKVISLRECPTPEAMIKMNGPTKALKYWQQHVATTPEFDPDVQSVVVLINNTTLRINGHYLVSSHWALNENTPQPRKVSRVAILAAAYAIVFMHRHPRGEIDRSPGDHAVTRGMSGASELLRIKLCDHTIVGRQRKFSFKETGSLKGPHATN